MINHKGMHRLNMQHFSFNLLLRFGFQSFVNTLHTQNKFTGHTLLAVAQ